MSLRTDLWMARRYLGGTRNEGGAGGGALSAIALFSFLGVVLGVGTLIVVMAVMDGFRSELLSRILAVNGQVSLRVNSGPAIDDYRDIRMRLEGLRDIQSVTPFYDGQAMLSVGDEAVGALVRGLSVEDLRGKPVITENIVAGDLANLDGRSLVMGARMARSLKASVGDLVTLIVTNPTAVNDPEPRVESYPIVALFDVGLYDFDSSVAFLPLSELQAFYRAGDVVNAFEVNSNVTRDTDVLIDQLWRNSDGRFTIQDWRTAGAGFFALIKTQQNVMFLVLSLIIIVAALNIVSSQIMLVNGKTRDIAILRTMGASSAMVLRVFFLVGASIGLVGTAVGVIGGVIFANNIDRIRQAIEQLFNVTLFDPELRSLTTLPAEVQAGTLTFVILFAVILSLAASLYPAWKAARREPVEALRYG